MYIIVSKVAEDTDRPMAIVIDTAPETIKDDAMNENSEGQNVTKVVPVVKDPTELVQFIHSKMDLDIQETFLKVGIDAGHGSLKVNLSMSCL